jgi:Tfp pilus assembly protein PilF
MKRACRYALALASLFLCLPARAQQPSEPAFNPYQAEKEVEVGRYYLKKGNYDAAIQRFMQALKHKPNFARPHRYLGEAYEKKRELAQALGHYREYLRILPQAPDARQVQKRINKLTARLEQEAARARKPASP